MINVLAVDDEAPIRQWLNYCIGRMDGFTCTTAASAQEGMELFQTIKPEIIISDIEMPGISGLEMLQQISRDYPDLYMIVLTSHEDFGYARTALKLGTSEYMLKTEMTEQSLLALLEKAKKEVAQNAKDQTREVVSREHFLQAVALHKTEEKITAGLLQAYGINFSASPILAIDYWNGEHQELTQEQAEKFPMLQNVVLFTVTADHSIIVANTSSLYHTVLHMMKKTWQAFLEGREQVSCGMSDIFDSPEQISLAMDQARKRGTLCFYEPDTKLFFDVPVPGDRISGEEAFRMEFMRLLMNQEFTAAYEHCLKFSKMILENKSADILAVKNVFISSVASFFHFAANSPEEADVQTENIKQVVMKCQTFPQVMKAVEEACLPFLQNINASSGMTAPIRQAVAYMDQHCAQKLTLSEIAEQAGFSPEYFSRIFSRETGVTFVTYLNNMRMKKAVSLLETTNLKVYEIAEKVGFSSLSYFSTAFKKKFGQNPYEYQVNYQRGKSRIAK